MILFLFPFNILRKTPTVPDWSVFRPNDQICLSTANRSCCNGFTCIQKKSILEKMDGESSYDDEVDPVAKEKMLQQELMELDQKYLLDEEKLREENVFI